MPRSTARKPANPKLPVALAKRATAAASARRLPARRSFQFDPVCRAVRRAQATKKNGAGKRGVGRTTTAEERALAAMLEKQLHKLGLERGRVTAAATAAGQGADLRFERIPAAKVDLLKKAIGR